MNLQKCQTTAPRPWARGLRVVFDAPRTAALQSCLLRTEGSGLGSLAEPPVLGVKVVKKRVDGVIKDVRENEYQEDVNCVKFIIGDSSDEEDDDPEWSKMVKYDQFSRKRQKSEGSSGVSTRMSTTMSNASSSFASNFSGASLIDEEDDASINKFCSNGKNSFTSQSSGVPTSPALFGSSFSSNSVVVDHSNVLCSGNSSHSSAVAVAHSHEMTYLCVNPTPALEILWNYFVCRESLVFFIPEIPKVVGIQDALITLLEYGESDLHCSNAVVLIERDRIDKTSLERMFSFLGFHVAGKSEIIDCLKTYMSKYLIMISDFSDLLDDTDDDNESLFGD